MTATFTNSPFASVLDQVRTAERNPNPSILELAYREPHPSGQPWHVIEAHEAAQAAMNKPQSITAEITFKPDIRAFELVPENDTALHLLRALGPTAKITIHL